MTGNVAKGINKITIALVFQLVKCFFSLLGLYNFDVFIL